MKLIPKQIRSDNKSKAEEKLFQAFKESSDLDYWYCLHSLGMSDHVSKRESEVDFVLISTTGIFTLEVKGGRIKRESGVWILTDRFNHNHRGQSPFKQVQSSLYTLTRKLQNVLHQHLNQYVFGYGVVFPDIEFTQTSSEWNNEIIFDQRDLNQPISKYIHRLVNYWQKRSRSSRKFSQHQVAEIINYLRGDFDLNISSHRYAVNTEQEIINLTREQIKHLDVVRSNPRITLSGGAGTGKTMLAMDMFAYNQKQAKKTLFLCFNKLLASHLKTMHKDLIQSNSVIDSLHNFIRAYINFTDEDINLFKDKKDLFQNQFPDKFLTAIEKQPIDKFDYLIVDEAQDILTEKYLSVLDALIVGGLQKGQWLICLDENQNIYDGDLTKVFEKIKSYSTLLNLNTNCRNTLNIVNETQLMTGMEINVEDPIEGMPVKHLWYTDQADQVRQTSKIIAQLLRDGFQPSDIIILSPYRHKSLAVSSSLRNEHQLQELSISNLHTNKNKDVIYYSTIHSYKGLENQVVILTDIEDVGHSKDKFSNKMKNYIGCTRARALLIILIKSDQRKIYKRLHQQRESDSN
ncbi:MAG: NERD domain-containing protein [Candidatus Saccharibacteria bacterium]|nr:NERD domain-containing protein [Candidatus Saccharibacteria bacterium]